MTDIIINPITRIEGHGKITVEVDDRGKVKDARFSILYLRGFEKFLEGCAIEDVPKFMPRICGVCPVAHHFASVKAVDSLLKAKVSDTGEKIRRLWYALNSIHDKVLILAGTGAPDLLLPDADQKSRNVLTIIKKNPELGKKVLELRKLGQEGSRIVSGKAIHPFTAVPGGVSFRMTDAKVKEIKALGKNAMPIATEFVELIKKTTYNLVEKNGSLLEKLGNIETNFLALTRADGAIDFYDGDMTFMDTKGKTTKFHPADYLNYVAENTVDYSYGKYPFWKALGFPNGMMRVGTLARMNVAEKYATPKANEYMQDFRKSFGRPAQVTMLYHYARAIELMHKVEEYMELIDDPAILGKDTIGDVTRQPGAGQGVGVVEAPRGLLLHHYETDEQGMAKDLNCIVATTWNNAAIDKSVKVAAEKLINTSSPDEKVLNTLEMVTRAYDPCLSCSAHTIDGSYPLKVEIVDSFGNVIRTLGNMREV
jgi:F420-non-reducing hydrogenase large subunit